MPLARGHTEVTRIDGRNEVGYSPSHPQDYYPRGMNDDELRTIATKRLKAKNDFYNYLFVWLGVSILVTGVWALSGMGYFWPGWVIGGMGVAALFQAIGVFGTRGVITDSAIDREVERLKGR